MKKFIAAVLSAALTLSCFSVGVYAEATSEKYTIDATAKVVSKVAPLTTVATFKSNITAEEVEVVNVDGFIMADDAYATENVFARIDGELYGIDVKYAYDPIQNEGKALADNTEIYNMAASGIDNNTLTVGGFTNLQTYAKIGYGSDNTAPANTETQTVKATKKTVNGEPVYVMENDSNNYAYLRSHYSTSSNYSTTLNSAIDSWTKNPIVTTVEFEADKLGNVSVFNNTPARNASKAITKGDTGIDALLYSVELTYVPNSVHFLEDGSVKLGGIYSNYTKSQRNPAQETDFTWEPGKKYTVSIVQRYFRGAREGYVDGVYVNGTKIFPNDKTVGHADKRVALQADGTFKIGTRGSDYTHGGGLSSVMIGTAPKTADENMTVSLSDVKVYSVVAYNPAMDAPITIDTRNELVTIDNDKAVIYAMEAVSEDDFDTTAKFVIEGDCLKAVSADGLVAKTYSIVTESVKTGFYNGENGEEVGGLADVDGNVCFTALVDKSSDLLGVSPFVVLAVYNNNQFVDFIEATGTQYKGEITKYKAVYDISGYDEDDNLEVRGFVWNGLAEMSPLTKQTSLK